MREKFGSESWNFGRPNSSTTIPNSSEQSNLVFFCFLTKQNSYLELILYLLKNNNLQYILSCTEKYRNIFKWKKDILKLRNTNYSNWTNVISVHIYYLIPVYTYILCKARFTCKATFIFVSLFSLLSLLTINMNVCAFLSISFLQNDDEKEEKNWNNICTKERNTIFRDGCILLLIWLRFAKPNIYTFSNRETERAGRNEALALAGI